MDVRIIKTTEIWVHFRDAGDKERIEGRKLQHLLGLSARRIHNNPSAAMDDLKRDDPAVVEILGGSLAPSRHSFSDVTCSD
jgi:hypothetical protein